jgi:hypothetical protein
MIGWLKKLLKREDPVIRVEVTIHVPEIRVLTTCSGKGQEGSTNTQGESGPRSGEGGFRLRSAPVSDEESLDLLSKKFGKMQTPEVEFGQEKVQDSQEPEESDHG